MAEQYSLSEYYVICLYAFLLLDTGFFPEFSQL